MHNHILQLNISIMLQYSYIYTCYKLSALTIVENSIKVAIIFTEDPISRALSFLRDSFLYSDARCT